MPCCAALHYGHRGSTNQLHEVLSKPTAREKATLEYFKSERPGESIKEHCPHLTREECNKKWDQGASAGLLAACASGRGVWLVLPWGSAWVPERWRKSEG